MPDMFASILSTFLNSASNATAAISKDTDKLDFSLIVIWFVALFAILTGALWTRYEFKISLDNNNRATKHEEDQQVQQSEITQINSNNNDNTNELKIANNSNDLSLNNNARLFHKSNSKSQRSNKKQTNQNSRTNNKQDLDDKNLTTISVGYFAIFILLILLQYNE